LLIQIKGYSIKPAWIVILIALKKYFIVLIIIIIRPNRLHIVHKMQPITTQTHVAWSACLSVCHTDKLCKNSSTNLDATWGKGADSCRSTCVLYGSQDQKNPFTAARGNKMVMWPFAK